MFFLLAIEKDNRIPLPKPEMAGIGRRKCQSSKNGEEEGRNGNRWPQGKCGDKGFGCNSAATHTATRKVAVEDRGIGHSAVRLRVSETRIQSMDRGKTTS